MSPCEACGSIPRYIVDGRCTACGHHQGDPYPMWHFRAGQLPL